MAGVITLRFDEATYRGPNGYLALENDATFLFSAKDEFIVAMDSGLDGINLSKTQLTFVTPQTNVLMNGTITIAIVPDDGDPYLHSTLFDGNATVTWPSTKGQQTAPLWAGNQVILRDFVG